MRSLLNALGYDYYTTPLPNGYFQAAQQSAQGIVVVIGGVSPGQTIDAVSALIDKLVKADRLAIATNIDGVYTADPVVDRSVKKSWIE
jgi:uridylate kinase